MNIETLHELFQFFLAVGTYVIIPAIIVYKMIRRKKLPNNEYTPYDDILAGRVSFDRNKIIEDNNIKSVMRKLSKKSELKSKVIRLAF